MTVIITRIVWLKFRTEGSKDGATNFLHLTPFHSKSSSNYRQYRSFNKIAGNKP